MRHSVPVFADDDQSPGSRRAGEPTSAFTQRNDWKVKDNLTWSYGVRYEAQNYINSTHDFAPRTSIAYGVPRKGGKKTITVLRGGFGIFYTRYGLGQITNIIQSNPANQTSMIYQDLTPACTLTSTGTPTAACTAGTGTNRGEDDHPGKWRWRSRTLHD